MTPLFLPGRRVSCLDGEKPLGATIASDPRLHVGGGGEEHAIAPEGYNILEVQSGPS